MVGGEFETGSARILARVLLAAAAGDRRCHAGLPENPRDRDLRHRGVQLLGDGTQAVRDGEAPLRVAVAEQTLVERGLGPDAAPDLQDLLLRPAGQDAAGERLVDRDRDPELTAAS